MIFGLKFSKQPSILIVEWLLSYQGLKWYHFVGKVGIFVSSIITFSGDELLRLYQTKREYLDGYRLRPELRECEIGQIDLHSIPGVSPAWPDNTHAIAFHSQLSSSLSEEAGVRRTYNINLLSGALTRLLSSQSWHKPCLCSLIRDL